jgi:spore germination protein GerM
MSRRGLQLGAIAIAAIACGWILFVGLPRWRAGQTTTTTAPSTPTPATTARITATLYFISEDGMSLVGVQREVPYGDTVLEQARHIVDAQIAAAPAPLAATVPAGTTLRMLYVTERGDAFVDLSGEARAKHTGGALDELFTVYSIVNALTANLPAVTRVQILIDGKEVDTLAGHVDLRHPLQKNMKWVRPEKGET